MKIIQRYREWCRTWTKGQLIFLFIVAAIPSIAAVDAMCRFMEAREAAYRWQEKALDNHLNRNNK